MSALIVPLYLIVLLVAIPQLSETIYVPALVELTKSFKISPNSAELTLTTYLLGFGVGVLIWGTLSDKIGRKPGFILGLLIYIAACYGCYITKNIESFYVLRFLQAFGASVGSVLGQAVARDAIQPEQRGKLFSIISMAMAFSPALGPIIGSTVVHYSRWENLFLVLIMIATLTLVLIVSRLPETRDISKLPTTNFIERYIGCLKQMSLDKMVLGYGFLVGAVNGILFGYFAEAPFFFMESLDLSSEYFGVLSFLICIPLLCGGWISHWMHDKKMPHLKILNVGILFITVGSIIFLTFTYFDIISEGQVFSSIIYSCLFIFIIMMGVSIVIPNALSHALQNYGQFAGTAASLFGFYYYCFVAIFTALMSEMHNGELSSLPLFFLIIGTLMFIVKKITLNPQKI